MTQAETILQKFLSAPNGEVSNRELRRICGFNEANARATELNTEWRSKGWDLRIVNTDRKDGRFVIKRIEGTDIARIGQVRRREQVVEQLFDEQGRPAGVRVGYKLV